MLESAAVFLGAVALITLSGTLVPGPNMAVVIGRGAGDRLAGARVTLGHMVAEVPLITALFLGLDAFLTGSLFTAIAILGGGVLIYSGAAALRDRHRALEVSAEGSGSTVMLGFLTSVSNPYWWIWWATIGAVLVVTGASFGIWMLPAFIAVHVGSDLVCYLAISMTLSASADRVDPKWTRYMATLAGGIMLAFGLYFLGDGLLSLI